MSKVYTYKEIPATERLYEKKVRGVEFKYISSEDFEKHKNIIGKTSFKRPKNDSNLLLIEDKVFAVEKYDKDKKDIIIGYIPTKEGGYVAFTKKNYIALTLIIAACLACLLGCGFIALGGIKASQQAEKDWKIEGVDGTDVSLEKPAEEIRYNTYWGYQKIIINKDKKVPFVNPEENVESDTYIVFTLKDKSGNTIYQSDFVKPNGYIEWDAYSYYSGKSGAYLHDLTVEFYHPEYDSEGEIADFRKSMIPNGTPNFEIVIL